MKNRGNMKTLKTVNVQVVIGGGAVEETHSFPDTKEGNLEAELKFLELMKEKIWNIGDYSEDDFEACLDDGYAKYGSNAILITHSN